MTECAHGMNPAWCATCRIPNPLRQPRSLEGVTIAARYDSKCPGCGDAIQVGEDVHLTTDDLWVCSSCRDRLA